MDASDLSYYFSGIDPGCSPRVPEDIRDTYHREEFNIDKNRVICRTMLINHALSQTKDLGRNAKSWRRETMLEKTNVFACYNWSLKCEFVLAIIDVIYTWSSYTSQYGRDNNYSECTRHDYKYLAFSVEAFKEKYPELAVCLDKL
jgi:hypothetical protein